MRYVIALLVVLGFLCPLPLPAVAAGAEKLHCVQCGMLVDETSPFSARIVAGEKTSWFCDIGDMMLYMKEQKTDPAQAQVKDYRSGAWFAASLAFYVSSPKQFRTPMGWGIAAFRDQAAAATFGKVDDLASILKSLK